MACGALKSGLLGHVIAKKFEGVLAGHVEERDHELLGDWHGQEDIGRV